MAVAIGIDLGTTTSSAAAVRDHGVVLVEDARGRRALPCAVWFSPDGSVAVGHEARSMAPRDPEQVVHSARRLLGRRFESAEVRLARGAYLYGLAEGPRGWPVVDARGGPYSVTELCACALKVLRTQAERFFGEGVRKAVVAVPASADDAQREQTLAAARIAGLEVLKLLPEPVAAALACRPAARATDKVLVFDLGGGTFDCAVVEGGGASAAVLAAHGEAYLGGDDVDLALAVHLATVFRRVHVAELRGRVAEWKALLLACEEAKVALGEADSAAVALEVGEGELRHVVDRGLVDRLASPVVTESLAVADETLRRAGLRWADLDDVLVVGGSSRLRAVRPALAEAFGREPGRPAVEPEAAICTGAALEAARLERGRPLSRPAEPTVEAVPSAIGLATAGGGFDAVIARGAPVPARGDRSYTTWRDAQEEMRFVVLQGDSERAEDCARLGEFVVDGLPPRPAGEVAVELVLEVGRDGLLEASATETTTGRAQRYRVRTHEAGREREP